MAFNKSDEQHDHWAFLEEIEAPMWADLKLEAKASGTHVDIDDDWFHRSHFLHQCDSHKLKSTLLHPVKGKRVADLDFPKPTSPKVPSSVSKSRGKHFRPHKWRETFTLDNHHPVKALNEKSSHVKPGSGQVAILKSTSTSSKGNSSTITNVVNSLLSGKRNEVKPVSSCGYSGSTSSVENKAREGSTSSSVTSGSLQQQQSKMVNQSFVASSKFVQVMKASQGRSFTTRQATKFETSKDRRQPRDNKSWSGKSSVGSSSSNPCSDGRNSMARSIVQKKRTPDSRRVLTMTEEAKNKSEAYNMSTKSDIQVDKGALNSKQGNKSAGKKSLLPVVTKSKVQNEKICARVPLGVRTNGHGSFFAATNMKEKTGLAAVGKENVRRNISVSQKCTVRSITGVEKESKMHMMQKNGKTAFHSSKKKIGDLDRGRNALNMNKKLPFRC